MSCHAYVSCFIVMTLFTISPLRSFTISSYCWFHHFEMCPSGTHLYKRVCPSVRLSVRPSVRWSVTLVQSPRFSAVFGQSKILWWIEWSTKVFWVPDECAERPKLLTPIWSSHCKMLITPITLNQEHSHQLRQIYEVTLSNPGPSVTVRRITNPSVISVHAILNPLC